MKPIEQRTRCAWLGVSAAVLALAFGGCMGMAPPVVTYDEYVQIEEGMSYEDAVQIIGEAGEELSRTAVPGVPGFSESAEIVIYSWMNSDGGNMNATFQNDWLMNKAQFGLQ